MDEGKKKLLELDETREYEEILARIRELQSKVERKLMALLAHPRVPESFKEHFKEYM